MKISQGTDVGLILCTTFFKSGYKQDVKQPLPSPNCDYRADKGIDRKQPPGRAETYETRVLFAGKTGAAYPPIKSSYGQGVAIAGAGGTCNLWYLFQVTRTCVAHL